MGTNSFRFKQFVIQQERSPMKVGTDGVLLGAWVDVSNTQSILDVGTGTGLIALMLAQRSSADIVAIDSHTRSFEEAVANVTHSPWKNRIEVQKIDFIKFCAQYKESFDLIVSNPPYFSGSLKPADRGRSVARHADTLAFSDLVNGSSKLIGIAGRLAVVYPAEQLDNLQEVAESKGFYPSRVLQVHPVPGTSAKRVLIEFSRKKGTVESTSMVIEDAGRHGYSQEYIELTRDFYLDF